MSRASSEDLLAQLHGLVGFELIEQLQSEDPKTRIAAVDRAMRFLKDNNHNKHCSKHLSHLQTIQANLPTVADELEKVDDYDS